MMRIALVYPGVGRNTVDWSGIPAGLARGLTAIGHEPELVPLGIPYGLRRATDLLALARYRRRGLGAMTSVAVRWRTSSAKAGLRSAEGIAGVVLMGTTFEIPRAIPYVTFDDMTVPQFGRLTQLPPPLQKAWMARQARAVRGAVACCVTGDWVADSLVEDYGIARERIAAVGLGANLELPPVEDRDWELPRLLFVGVDWERKGGQCVLDAFRQVRSAIGGATLDVVGRTPGLDEPGVTDHGWLDLRTPEGHTALAAAFRRATCFVMPSRFEPFGIVYVEAGLAGVPSIGTTVGGAPTAVGPGGLTVDPGDHDGLVRAMLTLADPATARRYGVLAREHAGQYTWENVARRIVDRLPG